MHATLLVSGEEEIQGFLVGIQSIKDRENSAARVAEELLDIVFLEGYTQCVTACFTNVFLVRFGCLFCGGDTMQRRNDGVGRDNRGFNFNSAGEKQKEMSERGISSACASLVLRCSAP